jgi:hypothetical protein
MPLSSGLKSRGVEAGEVSTANVEGLRLQPAPAGDVRGQFRMDTGQNFDWTQLIAMLLPTDAVSDVSAGPPPMAPVSKDGTFELKKVPSGTYQFMVTA